MTEDNFVDYVKVFVRSGNGGAGSSHLRREKFVAKGGPDGGDGEMVVILYLRQTKIFGRYFILSSRNISKLSMVKMEVNLEVLVLMERMNS